MIYFKNRELQNSLLEPIEAKKIYVIGRTEKSTEDYTAKDHRKYTLMDMKECSDKAAEHHGKRVMLKCKDFRENVKGVINFDHLDSSGFVGINHHNGKISWWKIRVDARNVDLIVDERTVYVIRELHRLGHYLVVPFESARVMGSKKRGIDSVDGNHGGRYLISKK